MRRLLACAGVVLLMAGRLSGQADEASAATTLDTLESLLGWPAPAPDVETDVRVMTRSTLAFVPLPLVRLTADADGQIVAAVTEWQALGDEPEPSTRPAAGGTPAGPAPRGPASGGAIGPASRGPAYAFAHPPLACNGDHTLCTGTPQTMKVTEAKAMWFALLIARSCNEPPRPGIAARPVNPADAKKGRTDAEDLFVRGRVGGSPVLFSCRGPNPKGATPGDRQAAAVLRMAHHLLGR